VKYTHIYKHRNHTDIKVMCKARYGGYFYNILKYESLTYDKGWYSVLEVGWRTNNHSPYKTNVLHHA
jgi:hypothetical protein